MNTETMRERFNKKFMESFCNLHEVKPCEKCGNVKDFIESEISRAIAKEREEIVEMINRYSSGKEVIEDGKRYLLIGEDKKPFGYPYPDSIEKYIVREIITTINNKPLLLNYNS